MSFTDVGALISDGNNSTSNSWTTTATLSRALNVGQLGVVILATDNSETLDGACSLHTMADSVGNNWYKGKGWVISQSAAAAGAALTIFWTICTVQIPTNGTLTFSFTNGSRAAKSVVGRVFDIASTTGFIAFDAHASEVVPAGDAGTLFVSGLSSIERLYLRGIACETNVATFTATSGFTSLGVGLGTGVMMAKGEFKISSSSGEFSNPLTTVTHDNTSVFAAMREVPRATAIIPQFLLKIASSTVNATSYVVNSYTARKGFRHLICVWNEAASAVTTPTITGFVQVATKVNAGSTIRMTVFKGLGTGVAATPTISFGAQTQLHAGWLIHDFERAGDVVQSASGAGGSAPTLSTLAKPSNMVLGYSLIIGAGLNGGITGASGWTDIGERMASESSVFFPFNAICSFDGSQLTPSISSLSGTDSLRIALELQFMEEEPITLLQGNDQTTKSTYDTAAVALAAKKLYLLTVGNRNLAATTPETPTVTGFAQLDTQLIESASGLKRVTWFRALFQTAQASAALSIVLGASQEECSWILDEIGGDIDCSGTNGAGAIVQAVTGARSASGLTGTVTLAAFSHVRNLTYASFAKDKADTPYIPKATHIQLGSQMMLLRGLATETEWCRDNDLTTDVTWITTNAVSIGLALELKLVATSTPTLTPSSNAVVVATLSPITLNEDAVIGVTGALSPTTNTVVQGSDAKTPASNTAIQSSFSKTPVTGALIQGNFSNAPGATAVVQGSESKTPASNTVIDAGVSEVTKTPTTDSAIGVESICTPTSTAAVETTVTKTPVASATVQAAQVVSIVANAVFQDTITKTPTASALILSEEALAENENAVVQGSFFTTPTSNTLVQDTAAQASTSSAVVQGSFIDQPSSSTVIQTEFIQGPNSSAAINENTITRTTTTDVVVGVDGINTLTSSALVQAAKDLALASAATVQDLSSLEFDVTAVIQDTLEVQASVTALVQAALSLSASLIDTVIQVEQDSSATFSSVVQDAQETVSETDALVQAAGSADAETSALIQSEQALAPTSDTAVVEAASLVPGEGAVVQGAGTQSTELEALIAVADAQQTSTSAFIQNPEVAEEVVAEVSALIKGEVLKSATSAAAISNPVSKSPSTNATVQTEKQTVSATSTLIQDARAGVTAVDTSIAEPSSEQADSAAVVRGDVSRAVATAATIQADLATTPSSNVVVQAELQETASSNTAVQAQIADTITVGGVVRGEIRSSSDSDTIIQGEIAREAAGNTVIMAELLLVLAGDSAIAESFTLDSRDDSVVQGEFYELSYIESLIRGALAVLSSGNAAVAKTKIRSAPCNAIIASPVYDTTGSPGMRLGTSGAPGLSSSRITPAELHYEKVTSTSSPSVDARESKDPKPR